MSISMLNADGYDWLIKCLIIGDSGVGKSSVLLRLSDDKYIDSYICTIGVDFKINTITTQYGVTKFQIWDTAGQERFRTITSSYYRGSKFIMICYDITDIETFKSVAKWLMEVKNFGSSDVYLVLCGTKCDLEYKRKVTYEEGNEFAKNHNMDFFECSAKNNVNIMEIFKKTAEKIINETQNMTVDKLYKKNNIILNNNTNKTKRSSCC